MMPNSPKLIDIMQNLNEAEKVRLFYELAKYLNNNIVVNEENDAMMEVADNIASLLNAMENI